MIDQHQHRLCIGLEDCKRHVEEILIQAIGLGDVGDDLGMRHSALFPLIPSSILIIA